MKNLVIVESPTKARTISRFLGDGYEIRPSMGHVMDLPKSTLSVDTEHDFTPLYEVMEEKKPLLTELKKLAKNADIIYLATDPDREGEAIAHNIQQILSEKDSKKSRFKRIVFHEITKEAIEEALQSPRDVDTHLVDAQTARRVLDRLVGYKLSPLLWKKVRRGLSAGRVQSVALRLIVEREKEREKFSKEDYFTIHTELEKDKAKPVLFDLVEIDNKKIETSQSHELYDGVYKISKTTIQKEADAEKIVSDISPHKAVVADVLQKETKRSPQPPFTTSTIQQEASRRYGFSGKRTMSIAQKLYEEGFITYHRTDSVNMAAVAQKMIREYVTKTFGEKYVPETARLYAGKQKNAQEAHEAIRPTKVIVDGKTVEAELGRDFGRLYDLVWRRAVASQMSDAKIESTTVFATLLEKKYLFKANGSVIVFEGFLKVNAAALDDRKLPNFAVGDSLNNKKTYAEKHETPPPPRYNDASIIATLEEKGIGRPSTYAAIISTLIDRTYVDKSEKRFIPTAVGIAVNDFLVTNFATIDDVPFTASMEDQLDNIATGERDWVAVMKEFYDPFEKQLDKVEDMKRVKIAVEKVNEKCPDCGNQLVIRTGKFGKFVSCSTFPDCKFTKQYVEKTGFNCPKDGDLPAGRQGDIIVKKTKKGRIFYGCSNYPKCEFAAWNLTDLKKPEEETEKKEEQIIVESPKQ